MPNKKTNTSKNKVVKRASVNLVETLKLVPFGTSAVFSFKELTTSENSVRSAATRLNKDKRFGRFSVKLDFANQRFIITRK